MSVDWPVVGCCWAPLLVRVVVSLSLVRVRFRRSVGRLVGSVRSVSWPVGKPQGRLRGFCACCCCSSCSESPVSWSSWSPSSSSIDPAASAASNETMRTITEPVTRDWVWRQTGGREGQVSSGNPKVHTACAARRHGGAASRCHGCRGVPLGPGVPPRSAQQSRQRGGEGTGGITHQRIVSPGATSYSLLESSTACLRYRLVGRRLDGEHLINGESRTCARQDDSQRPWSGTCRPAVHRDVGPCNPHKRTQRLLVEHPGEEHEDRGKG